MVLNGSLADLEMVIVDGMVREEGEKLRSIDLDVGGDMWDVEKGMKTWCDVSRELVKRRVEMQKRIKKIDMGAAKTGPIKGFHINESKIVAICGSRLSGKLVRYYWQTFRSKIAPGLSATRTERSFLCIPLEQVEW